MNAFNMIDGLNGICASLALIPIIFVAFLGNFSFGLLIPIGAILALAYNLVFRQEKKSFLETVDQHAWFCSCFHLY